VLERFGVQALQLTKHLPAWTGHQALGEPAQLFTELDESFVFETKCTLTSRLSLVSGTPGGFTHGNSFLLCLSQHFKFSILFSKFEMMGEQSF